MVEVEAVATVAAEEVAVDVGNFQCFPQKARAKARAFSFIGHNGAMRFRIGALLGWGVVIYAVMFLVWSAFLTYGFVEGIAPRVISFCALITVSVIAGRSLRANSWHDILPYSFSWGVTMAVLDVLMSVPFAGWVIFFDWSVWLGYAVVALAPLLALYSRFGLKTSPRDL